MIQLLILDYRGKNETQISIKIKIFFFLFNFFKFFEWTWKIFEITSKHEDVNLLSWLNLKHYRGSRERHQHDGEDFMIAVFWMSLTIPVIAFVGVMILIIFKQRSLQRTSCERGSISVHHD